MYVSLNNDNVVEAASKQSINIQGRKSLKVAELQDCTERYLIGKKLLFEKEKSSEQLRIALICNWGDKCGIATYTEMLVKSLRTKVAEVKIFAEKTEESLEEEGVVYCWDRGESMIDTINRVLEWKPDLVFVQHEFGIFPKATHFLKMLEMLDPIPYVITTHSVYEHLDKTVCTAYIKNLICHSNTGRQSLLDHGHRNDIYVIPHGCVTYKDTSELWNLFQTDYAIIQFGFGFEYKGVDMAVDAIKILKDKSEKFKDIFFCYMCSESVHTRSLQEKYYKQIQEQVKELGLEENVVVMRGFLSEQHLCNFMRTAKLAIFPYKNNPTNVVFGASGAIRKAMANDVPIIASESHMFDDIDGVLPRPSTAEELASEIDHVFSSDSYKDMLVKQAKNYVHNNTWNEVAQKHVDVFMDIIRKSNASSIRVNC